MDCVFALGAQSDARHDASDSMFISPAAGCNVHFHFSCTAVYVAGSSYLCMPIVVQVCGSRNTLAIDSDGQVLSWGWNARATLGHAHRCLHLLTRMHACGIAPPE